jgi:nicotinamide mononucleotide transporter
MTALEMYQRFISDIRNTRWQEWVSTVAQIASVWYARKNKVWVYPTGIVGVLLAAYVYYFMTDLPLYADAVLNLYYFVMSLYGWYNWVQKKDNTFSYPISWCSRQERIIGLSIFGSFWAGIAFLLSYTKSDTILLDSLVSASAVTAMWWMAKRRIENWLAWIASNIVAIPLNFYKGYMLFTLMYILFLAMAWWGFLDWKKMVTDERH